MNEKKRRISPVVRRWLITLGVLGLILSFPVYVGASLGYSETKGPFKNWMQVVDLEGDGDLDVLVSHTRWEAKDLSWAGIGQWINQGDGKFQLLHEEGVNALGGYAAGAGDADQDGDADVFTQNFNIKLHVNQGGMQEGVPGVFRTSGGIDTPSAFTQGYQDMGGTITMGDLNGDGRLDAFVAGCCYGMNAKTSGHDGMNAPSVSWVWINDGWPENYQTGHILPLDSLNGLPIRQVALGDLNGDGNLDVFAAVGKLTMGASDSLDDLILLNGGKGNMTVFDQPLGQTDSTSVALGDVNGDGSLDALVGTDAGATLWINQNPKKSGGPLFIQADTLEGTQTLKGKLQTQISSAADVLFGLYLPYVRTKAVFLADLDGDGDLDALLARLWGAEIWWNDGTGKFLQADMRFEYREDTGVAVADFDGDGDLDIFTGRNLDDYQVWWNDGRGAFITGN